MQQVSPSPTWMNQFEQLSKNPGLAAAPARARSSSAVMYRRVAFIAAGVFSVCGYLFEKRSCYFVGVAIAVIAYLLPTTKQLAAPRIKLAEIADGLDALTEFKTDICVRSFNNVDVTHLANRHAIVPAALNQWNATFNGEKIDRPELNQIQGNLEAAYIADAEEVQNYRRILPSAERLIAQDLTTSKNTQLVEIWNAAFRFVNGFDFQNGEMKPGYINLTINASHVIAARAWEPII